MLNFQDNRKIQMLLCEMSSKAEFNLEKIITIVPRALPVDFLH